MGNKILCKKKMRSLKKIDNDFGSDEQLSFEVTLSNFIGEDLPYSKNGLFLEINFGKNPKILTNAIKYQNNPSVK